MEVITMSTLKNGIDGTRANGVILIKGYSVKLTKGGKEYIDGTLQSGMVMSFKAWGNSTAFTRLRSEDYSNTPVCITGTFNQYQGTTSIVVEDVVAVSGYHPFQFFEVKYNEEAYATALISLCKNSLSEKGFALADKMLFSNEPLFNRFKKEFAASSHHDNCLSGLMVHTYKVLCLMNWVIGTYSALTVNKDGCADKNKSDLLIIGALMHDIGKTMEMEYGVYQPLSAVTHRILGLDILYQFREDIESTYDEKWFRDFQSIIVEHHGEFGDPCRTVVAYVVHKADCMDSWMTMLSQAVLERPADLENDSVYMDNGYLSL